MSEIAPSILSADFSCLGREIEAVTAGGAGLLHVDVMDGHFVPNLTVGLPVVESLRRATKLTLDVHLMITDPGIYGPRFVKAGANMVSVHVEADANLDRTLNAIKEGGAQAGVAINPATPLTALDEVLSLADYILLMSVNPGFGGQKFIPSALDKLRRLRSMIDDRGLPTRIEIDGGIDRNNVAAIAAAGADIIVSGSAIFHSPDPGQAVRELHDAALARV